MLRFLTNLLCGESWGQDKECVQLVLTVILREIKRMNLQIEGMAMKERKT